MKCVDDVYWLPSHWKVFGIRAWPRAVGFCLARSSCATSAYSADQFVRTECFVDARAMPSPSCFIGVARRIPTNFESDVKGGGDLLIRATFGNQFHNAPFFVQERGPLH